MPFSELSEQDQKILALETRRKLYLAVKKYAGSHIRALQRFSKLPFGSVQHHLHALVKSGLIKETRHANTLIYTTRASNSDDAKLLGFLRQAPIRKILICISIQTNPTQENIARFAKLSSSTISNHLARLTREKIITTHKDGKTTRYTLAYDPHAIANLLITYQESFLDTLVDRVIEMWEV